MQRHNQAFFGQKVALLFDSAKAEEPFVFIRFIKKKDKGWEKPSNKEGKVIKLGLSEIIAIVAVFTTKNKKFNTVHSSKNGEEKTSIVVENKEGDIAFNVGGYVKPMKWPESALFQKLLVHILDEKIANATGGTKQPDQSNEVDNPFDGEESDKSGEESEESEEPAKKKSKPKAEKEADSEESEEPSAKSDEDEVNEFFK